jgi:hypothetical protein
VVEGQSANGLSQSAIKEFVRQLCKTRLAVTQGKSEVRGQHSSGPASAKPPARLMPKSFVQRRINSVASGAMPATVMVDAERKLVLTTCSGSVTDEDLLQARRDVLANPHFDPSFDRLWDFSEVTQQQVTDATLGHLVNTSPSVGNISRAVVVSRAKEPLERVLAFIARSRQLNRRVAVFPNRETAEQWIETGRNAPSLE